MCKGISVYGHLNKQAHWKGLVNIEKKKNILGHTIRIFFITFHACFVCLLLKEIVATKTNRTSNLELLFRPNAVWPGCESRFNTVFVCKLILSSAL